jgi:glycosyltransferase involved in cell wall biosynthesis
MRSALMQGIREGTYSRGSMKVAWFGHKTRRRGNGLVRYSNQLTEGLEARGAQVLLFYHGPRTEEAEHASHLRRLSSFSLWDHDLVSAPGARSLIQRSLRDEEVDVAHVSLSFSNLDFSLPEVCHGLGIPIVATFHVPYDRRASLWGFASRTLYRVWSVALARYDAVVIFSHHQKEILARYGVPSERIHVIPNSVDTSLFRPGPPTYKRELGADVLMVYCGRLDPEKNVATLLQTIHDLELPASCKTVIVGNGVEFDRLRSQFAGDTVVFAGLVQELDSLIRILQSGDIFVLPSEVEGLSIAMLEAMACETATIATDVGGDGEALEGAGIVMDPKDMESQLGLALKVLVENPGFRRDLAKKARRRVVSRYSLQRNIDQVVRLYERLLATTD